MSAINPLAHAQRLAAKLLAHKKALEQPQTARYSVFMVTPRGYTHVATINAPSLREACRQHVRAWHSRVSSCAVVLRAPSGKRYSYADSLKFVGQPCLSA